MAHEKMGHVDMAKALYEEAFDLAKGNHNPPAAFVRREGLRKR
jgi:hypothetical protein